MLKKVTTIAIAACALVALLPASAHARTPVRYSIDVAADMSAVGTVYDNMFGGTYTGSLQVAGVALCEPSGPTVQLVDWDVATGNPLLLRSGRACVPFLAEATYVMEWAAVPGVSGQHVVECLWLLRSYYCTPSGVDVTISEGVPAIAEDEFEQIRATVRSLMELYVSELPPVGPLAGGNALNTT